LGDGEPLVSPLDLWFITTFIMRFVCSCFFMSSWNANVLWLEAEMDAPQAVNKAFVFFFLVHLQNTWVIQRQKARWGDMDFPYELEHLVIWQTYTTCWLGHPTLACGSGL
jgi:hypothetical protein